MQPMDEDMFEGNDLARLRALMVKAEMIYRERDAIHKGAWKAGGWQDSLGHIRSKVRRINRSAEQYEQTSEVPEQVFEKMLDDGFDLINYTLFFLDNLLQSNDGEDDL